MYVLYRKGIEGMEAIALFRDLGLALHNFHYLGSMGYEVVEMDSNVNVADIFREPTASQQNEGGKEGDP